MHMKRFRGGLLFKAHRLLHHSTLGVRVIKRERGKHAALRITKWAWPNRPRQGESRAAECERFRGELVFKAHRLLYHSTLGLRVIKEKKKDLEEVVGGVRMLGDHVFEPST